MGNQLNFSLQCYCEHLFGNPAHENVNDLLHRALSCVFLENSKDRHEYFLHKTLTNASLRNVIRGDSVLPNESVPETPPPFRASVKLAHRSDRRPTSPHLCRNLLSNINQPSRSSCFFFWKHLCVRHVELHVSSLGGCLLAPWSAVVGVHTPLVKTTRKQRQRNGGTPWPGLQR